eukprot:8559811-Ditylum_brightwellii.AAC.1
MVPPQLLPPPPGFPLTYPFGLYQVPKFNIYATWPKFEKEANFYIFFLKLSTILNKPEWGHGTLMQSTHTTANNVALSLALYNVLIHFVRDNHLLPFVNNETFRGKKLE